MSAKGLISVNEALDRLFALITPMQTETVPLVAALGRSLASDQFAQRDQPPFAASAMDGYALRQGDANDGARLRVIAEAAAGRAYPGTVKAGQAVRIFTGAPIPEGADIVVIQEDVTREGDMITLTPPVSHVTNIRGAAADFAKGDRIAAPRRLSPADLALLASMNIATIPVYRRPSVALIATGDELVAPGDQPAPDQIIASNSFGLHGLLTQLGAAPRLLPIARDRLDALDAAFDLAADADLIVTIGGASVGDHDLVAKAAAARGIDPAFYKVAMRPGKPLMAGKIGHSVMIGLPGNPVSAMVCGHIFLGPVIHAMLGHPAMPMPREKAVLATALPANGPRDHYLRAYLDQEYVTPFPRQDSSLLTVLADANCLIVQPKHDAGLAIGASVEIVRI